MDEYKLKKLEELIRVVDKDQPSSEEIAEVLTVVMGVVEGVKQTLEKRITYSENTTDKEINRLDQRVDSTESKLETAQRTLTEKFDKKILTATTKLENAVSKVEGKIPSPTDLTQIEKQIKELRKLWDNQKEPEEITPIQVRNKLESLKGDERFDFSFVKGLDEKFAKVEAEVSKKGGVIGGQSRRDVWHNGSGKTMGVMTVSATAPLKPGVNDIWIDVS